MFGPSNFCDLDVFVLPKTYFLNINMYHLKNDKGYGVFESQNFSRRLSLLLVRIRLLGNCDLFM